MCAKFMMGYQAFFISLIDRADLCCHKPFELHVLGSF